jgi:hypothetical protein
MNGSRYFLDTNCIINLLNGSSDNLIEVFKKAEWIGTSIISVLEYLSFANISNEDKKIFTSFISRIDVVDLNHKNVRLISKIIKIRQNSKIKLPDAIIVASAIESNSFLMTRDKELLNLNYENIKSY